MTKAPKPAPEVVVRTMRTWDRQGRIRIEICIAGDEDAKAVVQDHIMQFEQSVSKLSVKVRCERPAL